MYLREWELDNEIGHWVISTDELIYTLSRKVNDCKIYWHYEFF